MARRARRSRSRSIAPLSAFSSKLPIPRTARPLWARGTTDGGRSSDSPKPLLHRAGRAVEAVNGTPDDGRRNRDLELREVFVELDEVRCGFRGVRGAREGRLDASLEKAGR